MRRTAAAALVCLLSVALAPRPAAAAGPAKSAPAGPAASAPMTVDQLVAKNVEARGGAAKLGALRSLRVTGKVAFGAGDRHIDADWAQVQKRPAMVRTEPVPTPNRRVASSAASRSRGCVVRPR